jgi:hypothetical protein
MRKIVSGIAFLLTAAVLSGCATNTTVSQYAGMPRDALPRDHVEYAPASVGQHARTSKAVDQADLKPTTDFSLDDENQRLAKVLRICRDCGGVSPSAQSTEVGQASDEPALSPLREAQARH